MKGNLEIESKSFWCVLGINLFEGLSPEEMRELSRHTHNRKYHRGEIIYLPGDPNTTVYFLKRGRVKLVYVDDQGHKLTLAICRPGQPFGELTLGEERTPHRFLAQALEDVELCWISKEVLVQLAQERPQLSLRLTKWVGEQLRELQFKLEDLIFKDVPTRLAKLLEQLAHDEGQPVAEGIEIGLKLTHQEIAELIGSTRETTTLMLSQFKKSGLITKRRGRIVIQDLEALRRRAAGSMASA